MINKKKRLVCSRCGENPVWTPALRHGYNHCLACSITTACSGCGTGFADPRLLWRGHTFCGSCRELGRRDEGALGKLGESLEDIINPLRRFSVEVGGINLAKKQRRLDTLREAREWAESHGAEADWCNVYSGARLVASYRRTTGSKGIVWYRVESEKGGDDEKEEDQP